MPYYSRDTECESVCDHLAVASSWFAGQFGGNFSTTTHTCTVEGSRHAAGVSYISRAAGSLDNLRLEVRVLVSPELISLLSQKIVHFDSANSSPNYVASAHP